MKILIVAFSLALIAAAQCYPNPSFDHIEEITVNPFRLMSKETAEILRQKRSFPVNFGGGYPNFGGYGSPYLGSGGGGGSAYSSASASSSANAYGGGNGGYGGYPYPYFRY